MKPGRKTTIASRIKSLIPALALFFLLFPLYSRGLFEVAFHPKIAFAYAVQFLAALTGMVLVVIFDRERTRALIKDRSTILFAGFILVQAVSLTWTTIRTGYFFEPLLFSLVIAFLLGLYIIGGLFRLKTPEQANLLVRIIFIIGLANLFAAIIEQLTGIWLISSIDIYEDRWRWLIPIFNSGGYHYFDGVKYIRPTGIMGSYIHLPIIIPLIGAMVFRFAKNSYFRAASLLFLIIPFVAFSRSGMIISVFILAAISVIGVNTLIRVVRAGVNRRLFITIVISGFLIFVATALFLSPVNKTIKSVWSRVTAFGDAGNTNRMQIWTSHLNTYLRTNLFFGEYTGYSTNVARNILGYNRLSVKEQVSGTVPESSFLSILVGFGALGVITYFGIFIVQIIRLLRRKEFLLATTLTGALVQSFFFQSIEVLPFMFTLAVLMLLANSAGRNFSEVNNAIIPEPKIKRKITL